MNRRNASILVIDDDTDILTAVKLLLKPEVKEVVTEKNPENLLSHLNRHSFDLILLDMNFNSSINTGNEGFYWLKRIKSSACGADVIMITAYGDIDLAVRSLKEGAADFIVKPWHNEKLLESVFETLKARGKGSVASPVQQTPVIGSELLGESESMKDIFSKIQKIAPTDANILILGENGTGKDLIAKAIHQNSFRSTKPFIKVDVGALSESLFESELFGHKKGSFTGSTEDRVGRFESANGGTLFLDEIGNINLQQQSKLLTVLQNRQITKIGSNVPVDIDIRLICATNLPITDLANESKFRKDLIYRINTVEIMVPPLRKRGDDVIHLARYFVNIYAEKYRKPDLEIDDKALEKLKHYPFPGNVRELQYTIERAVIMSEGKSLMPSDLIFSPIETATSDMQGEENLNLDSVQKNTILLVIEKHHGNITRAAKELGLTRAALYRRLGKYGI
ncbi:MAG: sigma-54-dependent Fis family transcriptional regulator [Chitinophagaceae bacterium]|nr:sigma-54-dependent Fis family transcriptional regulator [Chitinophagaceae bacterium]